MLINFKIFNLLLFKKIITYESMKHKYIIQHAIIAGVSDVHIT